MILVAKQDVAQTCEVRRDIDAKGAERQSTTLSESSKRGDRSDTHGCAAVLCECEYAQVRCHGVRDGEAEHLFWSVHVKSER